MCQQCKATIRKGVTPGRQFKGTRRHIITIDRVEGDDVYLEGGSTPTFHLSHAAALLHWLHSDRFICAIGSGTTAIKTLVGKGGKLGTDCSKCAGNAADLYAVLAGMPGVRRDQQTGLGPDASTR